MSNSFKVIDIIFVIFKAYAPVNNIFKVISLYKLMPSNLY